MSSVIATMPPSATFFTPLTTISLAEVVEGARTPFNPHSPTPGRNFQIVTGGASAYLGCKQCLGGHGRATNVAADGGQTSRARVLLFWSNRERGCGTPIA